MPSMTKDPVATTPPGPKTASMTVSSLTPDRHGLVIDLAAERRRRRQRPGPDPAWWCPQRYGAFRCATIAELSAQLGDLQAAYRWLDQQRAAERALAEARRAAVVAAVDRMSWSAERERRRREWFTGPLQTPGWATGEGWSEPGGAVS
jgi:hypothetical protein